LSGNVTYQDLGNNLHRPVALTGGRRLHKSTEIVEKN
jgi:hypothetical protein